MPKLRMTREQVLDSCLRQAISGSAGYFQLNADRQAEIAGIKRATWYRRLRTPEEFSVKELRQMVRAYSWDDSTICSFFRLLEDQK